MFNRKGHSDLQESQLSRCAARFLGYLMSNCSETVQVPKIELMTCRTRHVVTFEGLILKAGARVLQYLFRLQKQRQGLYCFLEPLLLGPPLIFIFGLTFPLKMPPYRAWRGGARL